MLLYFKTENFRSFEQEIEFSMIAADYGEKLLENTVPLPQYGVSVLKSSVIYGANASGKSNLLKAMIEGREIIVKSPSKVLDDKLPHYYNKNGDKNRQQPTLYVFGILIDDIHYEYLFSNDSEKIIEEVLIESQNGVPKVYFYRKYNVDSDRYVYQCSPEFDTDAFKIVRNFVKKNNLFLSIAANMAEAFDSDAIGIAVRIYRWFKEKLRFSLNLLHPGTIDFKKSLKLMYQDADMKKLFLEYLGKADFLIKEIEIEKIQGRLPHFLAYTYHEGTNMNGQSELIQYDFLKEESSGTQQFVGWLAYYFLALSKGQTLLFDEFGNNMHPLLTIYLLESFHKSSQQAQLIFNTHDVKLIASEKMRDDQIWIIERDNHGNSTIEPLSNYDIADDKLRDNIYLYGSLRGIPRIKTEA